MLAQQLGGLIIVLIGLVIVGASFPVLRYSGRAHSISAQIGGNMLTWLMRVFGSLVTILGIVTVVQN
jgi:hypothetical protein